jgi:hypothetical protein
VENPTVQGKAATIEIGGFICLIRRAGSVTKKRVGVVSAVLGVALLILGIVWMTVIFPKMSAIPADLHYIIHTQGSVELLDQQTLQPVQYEVKGTRDYWVERCSGNTAYIYEDITFVDAESLQDLPTLATNALYAVDRTSRQNVPGYGDQDRNGYWCFPLFVEKGKDYPLWLTGNPATLDGKYMGEEEYMGIHVLRYRFETPEEGLVVPKGLFTPEMKIHQWLEMKVEPISGTGVGFVGSTRRTTMIPVPDDLFPSTVPPQLVEMTVYNDLLTYAPETTDMLVGDAKYAAKMLPIIRTYVPWSLIGLGLLLAMVSAVLLVLSRLTPSTAQTPTRSGDVKPQTATQEEGRST